MGALEGVERGRVGVMDVFVFGWNRGGLCLTYLAVVIVVVVVAVVVAVVVVAATGYYTLTYPIRINSSSGGIWHRR